MLIFNLKSSVDLRSLQTERRSNEASQVGIRCGVETSMEEPERAPPSAGFVRQFGIPSCFLSASPVEGAPPAVRPPDSASTASAASAASATTTPPFTPVIAGQARTGSPSPALEQPVPVRPGLAAVGNSAGEKRSREDSSTPPEEAAPPTLTRASAGPRPKKHTEIGDREASVAVQAPKDFIVNLPPTEVASAAGAAAVAATAEPARPRSPLHSQRAARCIFDLPSPSPPRRDTTGRSDEQPSQALLVEESELAAAISHRRLSFAVSDSRGEDSRASEK